MIHLERSIGRLDISICAAAVILASAACDNSAQSVEPSEQPNRQDQKQAERKTAEQKRSDKQPAAGGEESDKHERDTEAVRLSAEARERIEMRVESIQHGRLDAAIQAPAKVKHDVNRVSHISPLVEGQVTDVRVTLGDEVEADQVVALMRSAALGDARAAFQEAKAELDVAQKNFDRHRKLREKGIVSERAFIEARGKLDEARARHEAARARLQSYGVSGGKGPMYPLRNGIDGTVVKQHVARGEPKGPSDKLFVVADRSQVWVVGHVYESDIHHIERGMDGVVTLEAHPDKTWTGTVDWVGEMLEGNSRVLPVRVTLDNTDGLMRPGMFGQLKLMPAEIDNPVPLVPVEAIQRIGGREAVFVPGDEPGVYQMRPIETGAESDGLVEIRSGLEETDRIVTDGSFKLKTARRAK